MVRIAAFILDSQMTTSDPTMLVCLSIRSSPVIKFKSFYFFAFFLWFQLLPKDIFKKFLYDLRRPLLHIPSGAGGRVQGERQSGMSHDSRQSLYTNTRCQRMSDKSMVQIMKPDIRQPRPFQQVFSRS